MILKIENLSKSYGKQQVLSDINIELNENECLGIMGESGSGKSTLAKLLVRLEKEYNGIIEYDNINYEKLTNNNILKLKKEIQFVFQNSLNAVNPKYTVEKILLEPLEIHKKNMPKEKKIEKIISMLKQVGLSEDYLKHNPRNLSGGQLQRVCIARALILEPKIIIFDESLSGLDPLIQVQILELLAKLKDEWNLTYILISHDFEACYYLCDKIVLFKNGKLVKTFTEIDSYNPKEMEREVEKLIGNE